MLGISAGHGAEGGAFSAQKQDHQRPVRRGDGDRGQGAQRHADHGGYGFGTGPGSVCASRTGHGYAQCGLQQADPAGRGAGDVTGRTAGRTAGGVTAES